MKQTVALHFQWIPNGNEGLMQNIFKSGRPFIVSYPPILFEKNLDMGDGASILWNIYPETNYYPDWAKDIFVRNSDNSEIVKFQEGYLHYCEGCVKEYKKRGGRDNKNAWPDPWHEIDWYCNHVPKTQEDKKEVMIKGKNLLEKLIGEVEGYCPPQHYSSKKGLEAASNLGFYNYFMTRNLAGIHPYFDNGLTVFPCAKIGSKQAKTSSVISTYFDHLTEDNGLREEFFKKLSLSVHPDELYVLEKPPIKSLANNIILKLGKRKRDWAKRFNIK